MEGFVNRQEELAVLEEWWDSPTAGMGLLWGRRRVGKTALLQRFGESRPTIFHTGVGRPTSDDLMLLTRMALPHVSGSLRDFGSRPFIGWEDALDSLAQAAAERPLLLILDEFPELVSTAPDLPGILRAFTDRVAGRTRLRILVCGSAVRVMQAIQEERAPLFGRFGLRLQLHPFRPHEAALMLPDLSPKTRAVVWGLLGGPRIYL